MTDKHLPAAIDTSKPSIARVYDVMLGGKDNFEVDRAFCEQLVRIAPEVPEVARSNRRWLVRVVRWLAHDAGIDQFLDIGAGLPTAENTHEVAQRINPHARVVYVDNDPTVIAHGRALLEGSDYTFFCAGDLTRPGEVLGDPVVTGNLDLDRPVAILQCLTLHHLPHTEQVRQIMTDYVDALPSGSYAALTHGQLPEGDDEESRRILRAAASYRDTSGGFTLRTPDEIRSLLPGMELVEPGLVTVTDWWPEGPPPDSVPTMVRLLLGGVARKP